MIGEDLAAIERHYNIQLGHLPASGEIVEKEYYPQLDAAVRAEGANMARHYEVFYSLERSIRTLVDETFVSDEKSSDWWDSGKVPESIKTEVTQRIKKEVDAGVSRRSQNELDYTTFGELAVIITANWALFGSIFNSKRALEKVFASLNALRNPIAHCCPLAEDEELRLRLTVRDWFRLMEK
ncbi:Swt1 family HEPN domain-containing protein [Rhizobium rhizogenes]|uniref:Swt1 family HEPN domain-containing protein n=1 Tax=Rhizobium rhizogenes TaxID=359 RepID=UPI00192E4352|nr:Swt1 family HEPN domain-containing protein [Rhizobium rhizogenes]